ncbi:MAG: DUF2156 domain-containing protein [Thermoplasmata archaeon]|nr:DUF2156 domain-containing protein [Thermoplasmata archaeon]
MISIEDFKPITMADKPVFDEHYAKYPPNHSENVFTTLVSWNHFLQSYFLVQGENLVIMTKPDGQIRIRSPSGPPNIELVKELMEMARSSGTDYLLMLIENEQKEWLSSNLKCIDFMPHRDYFDYVYLASDLVELAGKKYLKIRNKINKFNRQWDYEVVHLCEQNIEEIKVFLQRWCLWKDCGSDPILENERGAVQFTIDNCLNLNLCGLAIKINGDIQAVSVFESISEHTAVIHFEKAMPDFEGLYQIINKESAKLLAQDHEFINRQSDMGIEGLRTAKQRYHPHHMVEVHHIASSCGEIEEKGPAIY